MLSKTYKKCLISCVDYDVFGVLYCDDWFVNRMFAILVVLLWGLFSVLCYHWTEEGSGDCHCLRWCCLPLPERYRCLVLHFVAIGCCDRIVVV